MPTHKLMLEVHKRTSRVPQQVVVRQGETATQVIEAEIINDGVAYTSSCTSVRLDILRADGKWSRVTATKSGTKATCTLPNEALSSPGLCRLAHFVFFTGTTKVETTEGFELRILPAVDTSNAQEEAQNYDDLLTQLWVKWSAYEAQAEKNEQARVSAESARVAAESERAEAEDDRASAEETRESNEATRKSNETARKSAETKRANAEKARAEAETGRETAEQGRVSAENGRVSAEASRVAAEQQRTSEFNAQMQNSQNATAAATGAASDANTAAANCWNVANQVAQGAAGDSGIAEMKRQIDAAYSMLADVTDGFIYMDGTIYAPSSKASVSGSTITLGSTCSASGSTITLA